MGEERSEMWRLREGTWLQPGRVCGRSRRPCHGRELWLTWLLLILEQSLMEQQLLVGIAGRKLEGVYRVGESCAQPSYYPFDRAEHRGVESFRMSLAFRVGPVCLPIRNRPLGTKFLRRL